MPTRVKALRARNGVSKPLTPEQLQERMARTIALMIACKADVDLGLYTMTEPDFMDELEKWQKQKQQR